jgi:hypothetical protein
MSLYLPVMVLVMKVVVIAMVVVVVAAGGVGAARWRDLNQRLCSSGGGREP